MKGRHIAGVGAVGLAAYLTLGAAPAPKAAPVRARPAVAVVPSVLDGVVPGLWEIAGDAPGSSPHRLCVANAGALVQVAHPGAVCTRLVIADEADRAIVHYSCAGSGWGRTSLRLDAAGDVAIDTQGIAANAPFAWAARAHRTGSCQR